LKAYYNEFNPKAAAMLRELIANNLIAPGVVDERSITEVQAEDLNGFTQCHFFAGIGGWSVALREANWPDDKPVWTGSCPCQPFSAAGKRKGKNDERHLWPIWYELIKCCKPATIFGEQVSSAITHGWWDDVANDLEAEGYETGAAVLPACSVGKPHKRDRLWFMGYSKHDGSSTETIAGKFGGDAYESEKGSEFAFEPAGASSPRDVSVNVANANSSSRSPTEKGFQSGVGTMRWVECPDGKRRVIEPGIRLLADGVQFKAPLLHGFGNAIVPQVGSAFISATRGLIW